MAHRFSAALVFLVAVSLQAQQKPPEPSPDQSEGFRFKSSVELVNVTATVTEPGGRFVSGLTRDDFTVYEDNVLQTVTHFGADRVPVSLGIVLDTSGSMEGSKIRAARAALEEFLEELQDPQDEFFLYQFSDAPILLRGWTTDRREISQALSHTSPDGGTALFEAVARAVPLVATGRNAKKALLLISDGNDSSGRTRADDVQRLIRETEVLVYAIGIDGDEGAPLPQRPPMPPPPRFPGPTPFPRPPGGLRFSQWQWPGPPRSQGPRGRRRDDRVNAATLRNLTDDSGGRTEIIRDTRNLRAATSNIADELSQQYYLGYPASGKKDGRWHAIRVEVRNGNYRVRARRGYVAS
jgi:VWFA-related protein